MGATNQPGLKYLKFWKREKMKHSMPAFSRQITHTWGKTQKNQAERSCSKALNRRRRHWRPTSVLLPGNSHGQRSLVGCSPWGRWQLDTTQWLHFHFSLSCIGKGNGNPLHCSCLENPRDGGAWWAPIYGAAQSWTRLKRLSSSSSSSKLVSAEIEKNSQALSSCWEIMIGMKSYELPYCQV